VYDNLNRYREAEPLYLRVISARRRVLGDVHPVTIQSVARLAAMYSKAKRYEDAEAQLLAVMKRVGDNPTSLRVHGVDLDLGKQLLGVYEAWGRTREAAEWRARLQQ
jgi:hypothetical protein